MGDAVNGAVANTIGKKTCISLNVTIQHPTNQFAVTLLLKNNLLSKVISSNDVVHFKVRREQVR